ncbi:hypothetical protein [Acinetobacter sp. YH12153]|nr:hypothetical protein [Acinetobacter sp. YH12153]
MARYDEDEHRATRNAKKFAGDTVKEFKAKPILIIVCAVFLLFVLKALF